MQNKKCLIYSMNGIPSKELKQELIKAMRFLCLALMIKHRFKTVDVIDQFLVIRVDYIKNILINIQKSYFCQANCFNLQSRRAFLASILNLKNITEELMPIVRYLKRRWSFSCQKMKKTKWNRFLLSKAFTAYEMKTV